MSLMDSILKATHPFYSFFCTQKEKFHTHLAVLYLERVLSLLSQSPTPGEQVTRAREKLQALLRESNLYRVQLLLGETPVLQTVKEPKAKFASFGHCFKGSR